METLHNGFTLELCEGAFPLSTDSIALSGFVRLPKNAKVLDLGSGCGTLGLLLCACDKSCTVTGIERDSAAHKTALHNASVNSVSGRLTSICADLRTLPSFVQPGSFDICISNPPYFLPGAAGSCAARHEEHCSLADVFKAAGHGLRFGGDFYLVHKPERLAELCACAAHEKLEPKRLLLLRHRRGSPICLVLLQCRRGAKAGLVIEEEYLREEGGAPSDYFRRLYHI